MVCFSHRRQAFSARKPCFGMDVHKESIDLACLRRVARFVIAVGLNWLRTSMPLLKTAGATQWRPARNALSVPTER